MKFLGITRLTIFDQSIYTRILFEVLRGGGINYEDLCITPGNSTSNWLCTA
jgi:hypothetical protein